MYSNCILSIYQLIIISLASLLARPADFHLGDLVFLHAAAVHVHVAHGAPRVLLNAVSGAHLLDLLVAGVARPLAELARAASLDVVVNRAV